MELTANRMYQAILDKDPAFEGVFFTCVKTTGIFCRPVCTARKPKFENVEFVGTTREAITKGYRPCKRCCPLQLPGATPSEVQALLIEIQGEPEKRLSDQDLRARGLDPQWVRRWFQQQHGMTFHAYQRLLRLNIAFKKLRSGTSVTEAAYTAGYESLSGFGDSFKTIFGVSPKAGKAQGIIDLTRLETPLGTMFAAAVPAGVCLLEFTDRKMLPTELKALAKHYNATILQGDNPHFTKLRKELAAYFAGELQGFSVPLATPGSPFQQAVWKALRSIPYGQTRSYREQANHLGKPGAVRAVGRANGMNRISIIVPCHRVIGADGSLTGYGGGLWRKRWLLDLEQQHRAQVS